jgi:protein phosphatase
MGHDPNQDTAEIALPATSSAGAKAVPSSEVVVDLAALSHPGLVRENNEDVYLVGRYGRSYETLLTNIPLGHVPRRADEIGYGLLVADGMGGQAAGEVASRMAAGTLVQLALETPDWLMRLDEPQSAEVMRRMAERYRQVDAALKAEADADPRLWGMGTTMTLAVSLGADLFVAHVGDSRAYFFREGKLHRLTRDHTYAQGLADIGLIPQEDVATHHRRHVLTRALGVSSGPGTADLQRFTLRDGDQVLLCTDGLTDLVADDAVAAVLARDAAASEACRDLVDLALARGGRDNVTVALARYRFPPVP